MVEHTMDVSVWLRKQLEETSPDLLRAMVKDFAEALMSADADAACGAGYGERSPERVNRRNGYRERDWDTRVGSIELAGGSRPTFVWPIRSPVAGYRTTSKCLTLSVRSPCVS